MMRFKAYGAALVLAAVASGGALADQPGPDWMTADAVKRQMLSSGYSEVTKLEADDGHWDGEGIKDGRKMKFELDPKTGAVLGEMPD
ncbi:PepSY domain-containing protein [Methylobacterium sp. Leaf399]|uniref:PepSY domain-containing protein n=2 Tax=unclassified Methylobacterium TaxID=2615210 RepID=UPI003083A716